MTGAPLRSLADSTAAHGAVMLSVAARIGATRLLDNIVLVGDHHDLGALPVIGGGNNSSGSSSGKPSEAVNALKGGLR